MIRRNLKEEPKSNSNVKSGPGRPRNNNKEESGRSALFIWNKKKVFACGETFYSTEEVL